MSDKKSVFKTLSDVPIKDKVERKGNIDYMSWAYAWSILKHNYPTAQRIVYEDPNTGWNYFTDGRTAWVKVGVVVEGQEHIDYLPIMDNRNNAIVIDKVNQFDVNKAIQRSTAKAIAMHGLGLQLWTGEDLPEDKDKVQQPKAEDKSDEKIKLAKDDENWGKVVKFIEANKKAMTFGAMVTQLTRKYDITKETLDELKKVSEATK